MLLKRDGCGLSLFLVHKPYQFLNALNGGNQAVSQATVMIDRIRAFLEQDLPFGPLVHKRNAWLGELNSLQKRADEEVAILIIILFGGTGVGKSTTVNALVGAPIAETSMLRPCTDRFVFYGPPGLDLSFLPLDDIAYVQVPATGHSSMQHVLLVDAPDCDSINEENLAALQKMMPFADVFLTVATHLGGKYKIDALFDLLRRHRESSRFIFLYNKRDFEEESSTRSVVEDWRKTLEEEGFESPRIFTANAQAVCQARENAIPPMEDDVRDIQLLREWIFERIRSEDVRLIKRGNVFGALEKLTGEMELAVLSMTDAATRFEMEMETQRKDLAGQWYRRVRQRVRLRWRSIFRGQLITTLSQECFGLFGTAMRMAAFYSLVGLIPWHVLRMIRGRVGAAGALAREGGRLWSHWRSRMDVGPGEFQDLYIGFLKTLGERSDALRMFMKEEDLLFPADTDRNEQKESDLDRFTHRFPELWNSTIERTADRLRLVMCNVLVQVLLNIPPLAIVGWTAWGSFSRYIKNESLSVEYYVTALVLLVAVLFLELWFFRTMSSVIGRWLVLRRLRNAREELSEGMFHSMGEQVGIARRLGNELGRIRKDLKVLWKKYQSVETIRSTGLDTAAE
jgi:hypothetical protein